MPFSNDHAARLRDPARYERFRRENDKFAKGIHAIWGILRGGKVELQSIRFDAGKFTADEARKWLKAHHFKPILFEPATGGKESQTMGKQAFRTDPGRNATVPSGFYIRGEPGGVKIEAGAASAEGKSLRRFSMTAYTGGAMTLSGWPHPVVVDLAGLAVGKKSRPILMDHDTGRIVGHTDAVLTEGGALTVAGVVSGVGSAAQEVIGASDNGFPWQASLGAAVKKVVFVPEGKSASANGKEFAGPVYMVRSARLGEVSFVALGADDSTSANVEAGRVPAFEGNSCMEVMPMDFEQWVKAKGFELAALSEEQTANLKAMFEEEPAGSGKSEGDPPARGAQTEPEKPPVPAAQVSAADAVFKAREEAENAVRTERERVAAIQEICSGEYPRIERDAIRLGWGVDETSQKVLKAMRESRPQADVHVAVRSDKGANYDRKALEAALCMRAGVPEDALLKEYGEQIVESASQDQDMSFQQLFAECAKMEGVPIPRTFCNETIRAAFSTVSLPGILNNVANKKLLRAFEAQPIVATRLCSEGELNDFKESERYRLTDVGDLEPVAPDGELKHGGLKEEKATNQVQTFGKVFSLTREMIYNDDLGAFMKVPEGMGARAARKIDQLFFARLLANPIQGDGKALFAIEHKNWRDGVDTALSADALTLAIQMFMDQTDADGQPINVNPKFLLVPTALKMTARELLNSVTFFATGSANKVRIPTYNALTDEDIEVVTSPYLSNVNYPGASSKAWFLFADPTVVDTFEIGYLKGRRVPTVEEGETDFDTLGIKFRVYFDLGVREQDYRGMTKFKGEV
ncbi:MAG: Mu-like prophage major head subunit gpT family protein [Planctomycetota bacterium]